jgi:glycosyltransferase involved in cell wall biosynthesis
VRLEQVSVIVTTHNEEANLGRCLESAKGFAETIVVDSFSADHTIAIARTFRAAVYQRPYASPSDQKNWAAARARNDWVLVLDADESLETALRAEIESLEPGDRAGFWIRRRSEYMGRAIRGCGWQRDKVLRLYDRRSAAYAEALVHEEVETRGVVGRLNARLRHTPYRDVAHHLEKIDAYTTRGARQVVARSPRSSLASLVNMVLHPPFRFLRMYLLQYGFVDGYPGLVLCLLSSYSVFLKYAKVWELGRRT